MVVSQAAFKHEVGLVSPAKRAAVASFSRAHIEVTARPIADVVWEFIGTSVFVAGGMAIVGSFAESELFLFGGSDLVEGVEAVFAEETTVVFADVGVAAGSIGAVVGDLTLRWDCPVGLHNKFNTSYKIANS